MDHGTHDRDTNHALLREIASLLADESWIAQISVFPSNRPESIVIFPVSQYYPPEHIAEIYVEIQSYTNGDFHITYFEDHHGVDWVCRWDRHESPDYTRDHFHAPPDAQHADGESRDYPRELLTVISQVIAPWVYNRIEALWEEVEKSNSSCS